MKIRITDNKEHAALIQEKLRENDGYCPCVYQSKGKPEYKCMCHDFIENTKAGETCHCGLYIKEES